jgi:hypothetical protein
MKSPAKPRFFSEGAAALIIVLALVVLLSGMVLAYLSRATADRPVSHSSFNQSKGDQFAASAMDSIIGDLRQEIVNGSTGTTVSGYTIYSPTTTTNMLPMCSPSPVPGTTPAIPNLVRRSVRAEPALWPDPSFGPARGSRASAVNSTVDVSANGRAVSLARWNSHYLVPKANTADDKSDPITTGYTAPNYWAPDWVFVTNGGATVITSPSNLVIGRYAYAIYDEGGLLDINAAGYPNGTTATQSGRKGSVAFADLSTLPYPIGNSSSPFQVDRIVGWRNYATTQPSNNFPDTSPAFAANFLTSSTPATNFFNFVISNTTGFLNARTDITYNQRTDQAFLTRQQLIAFRKGTQFDANALQYLGTFSRERNAPSWTPTQNATDMGAADNGAGNVYAYKTNANSSTAINRNLLSVRVTTSFTRADGTTAAVGEPLINRRFPLSRINGLSDPTFASSANSTIVGGVLVPATAATVQRDFGLLWNSGKNRWDYVGASGSTVQTAIKRLDQVAAENREPNFFELLKAAILSGSLGMGSGSTNTFVLADTKYYSTMSSDYQILQIGANIIDAWDSDNVPTFINFYDTTGNYEIAGTENLPYLGKLVFKPSWTTGKAKGTYQFDAWLLPSLWNPHQNAPSAAQNIQIAMTSGSLSAGTTLPSGTTNTISGSSTQYMTVNANTFTITPSAPTAAATPAGSSITKSPDNYYGFHVAFPTPSSVPPDPSGSAYPIFGASGCNFDLQVQINGTWKSYQKWKGCNQPATPLACQSPPSPGWLGNATLQDPEFVTLDPRTLRFGVWGNAANLSGASADYTTGVVTTLDVSTSSPPTPAYEAIPAAITTLRPNGSMFASPTSPNLYLYANNTDGTVYYKDLDGVKRQGDFITSGMTTAMQPADFTDRPLILSHRFQSIADLGQIFRDQPWKTLNFTTANPTATVRSADAGLLDIFTLHECGMEAGKTSLNTRQTPVLTAILSQAIKYLSGTSTDFISSPQRNNIVTALQNLTTIPATAQPMVNKAELVTRLAADSSVTGLGNKEARECVLRAFSDACQTRTWNLMIDVIAQSGRYKAGATSLQNDFVVEGEQRYWVHVAIDRFTGQVIDRQIELVKE